MLACVPHQQGHSHTVNSINQRQSNQALIAAEKTAIAIEHSLRLYAELKLENQYESALSKDHLTAKRDTEHSVLCCSGTKQLVPAGVAPGELDTPGPSYCQLCLHLRMSACPLIHTTISGPKTSALTLMRVDCIGATRGSRSQPHPLTAGLLEVLADQACSNSP